MKDKVTFRKKGEDDEQENKKNYSNYHSYSDCRNGGRNGHSIFGIRWILRGEFI